MSARIDGLRKMLDTCSPKMKALLQQQLDKEMIEQYEATEKLQRVRAERKKIAEGMDDAAFALAEEEFGEDYTVELFNNTWRVISDVAREHHPGEYYFNTQTEAHAKYRWLVLQRLYDKYVRTGEATSIHTIGA
jgi:hypothetical protein